MKFSGNRLYVEEYIKCSNCGVLIYVDKVEPIVEGKRVFCSDWCVNWHAEKHSSDGNSNGVEAK